MDKQNIDVLLPPRHADIITTACDYCVVACGYKVYRWPVSSPPGGAKADQNAFGLDFPTSTLQLWVAPQQHNIVQHNGSASPCLGASRSGRSGG